MALPTSMRCLTVLRTAPRNDWPWNGALANDDGTTNNNTAVGYNALNANTSGASNTAIGANSLTSVILRMPTLRLVTTRCQVTLDQTTRQLDTTRSMQILQAAQT